MPATVYKGDLAEVSFAPEVGLSISANADSNFTISHGDDHSIIVFAGLSGPTNGNTTIFETVSGSPDTYELRYPRGMLVGSQVKFSQTGSDLNANDTAGVFTIVYQQGNTIKISPKMLSTATTYNQSGINLHILPYKTPAFDNAMTQGAGTESVLTDQFLGIANALTVPETKVDLKRFHVVGLGRDTSVQVPGKFITEGGSFEVAMHSARWLKYCLGGEVVAATTAPDAGYQTAITSGNDAEAGQSFLILNDASTVANNKDMYLVIVDTNEVPVTTTHEADGGSWAGTFASIAFDNADKTEVRRIIGKDGSSKLYLDEPLLYSHAAGTTVYLYDWAVSGTNPPAVSSTNVISNAVTHLLYTNTYQPSFSLEVSQRRLNVDSGEGATDGSATDSKELSRVFRGCKVTDFTLTTDNDAALRLAVNFNSALCYTDTGRLEGTPITRYAAHRMFDDTANTDTKRFISGIAPCTQKPFMFYNGTINMAGVQVAQVLNFTLTGQMGMQSFHVIKGQNSVSSATEQVPFGGSRNTSLMVEGQTTYDMSMEIIVDDPIFFHEMRSAQMYSTNADASTANQIRIDFEKTTTTGDTERMLLIIDDYVITEAPLQIPEDKGAMKSQLKIMPKTIKVIARDTIPKY